MKKSLTQVLRMFRCSSNFFRSKAPPFYTLTLFTYTSLLICRLTSVKPGPPTLEFGDNFKPIHSSRLSTPKPVLPLFTLCISFQNIHLCQVHNHLHMHSAYVPHWSFFFQTLSSD